MTHTTPGLAPEHTYEPSYCNQALALRRVPELLREIDEGGVWHPPMLTRARRTLFGQYVSYRGERQSSAHREFDQALTIGARIRAIRTWHGWTQTTLARSLGITRVTLDEFERGSIPVRGWRISQMAEALDVSPESLLYGEPFTGVAAGDGRAAE